MVAPTELHSALLRDLPSISLSHQHLVTFEGLSVASDGALQRVKEGLGDGDEDQLW